jgi:hypothetical protein
LSIAAEKQPVPRLASALCFSLEFVLQKVLFDEPTGEISFETVPFFADKPFVQNTMPTFEDPNSHGRTHRPGSYSGAQEYRPKRRSGKYYEGSELSFEPPPVPPASERPAPRFKYAPKEKAPPEQHWSSALGKSFANFFKTLFGVFRKSPATKKVREPGRAQQDSRNYKGRQDPTPHRSQRESSGDGESSARRKGSPRRKSPRQNGQKQRPLDDSKKNQSNRDYGPNPDRQKPKRSNEEPKRHQEPSPKRQDSTQSGQPPRVNSEGNTSNNRNPRKRRNR